MKTTLLALNQKVMNWGEVMFTIIEDERFGSYQNFDPELLERLEYFERLPKELIEFCFHSTPTETEPYFEDVLNFVLNKMMS